MATRAKSRRKRDTTPSLPLRYRLPNPPPVFVGRESEIETLVTAIKRAPVTVVWGLGGIGKTALVLHTLHRHFSRRVVRALILNLAPGDEAEIICISTIRALAEIGGHEINWPSLMADPDSLAATAIDLAEMGNWWIVVDNLHHANPDHVAGVLGQFARYARRSRWMGISRIEPPMQDLAGQILPLAGMAPDDLRCLAEETQPRAEPELLDQAVAASGGSPWQLQQLLAGKQVAAENLATDLLAGQPAEIIDFLKALCVLDRPFEPEVLAAVTPAPTVEQLRTLERQALLEHTDAGWRLHDVARPLVAGTLKAPQRAELERRCAEALAEQPEPVALLEAVRLLCADIDRTATVLDRHGEQLLANGRAPELWRLLEGARDERLSSWRLRVAVELGEARSLSQVQPPDQPSVEDRWMWARALYGQGQFERAAEVARAVRSAAPTGGLTFECGLLESRALRSLGRSSDALAVLEALDVDEPASIARREVVAAVYHVDLGQQREAHEAIARARPHFDRLSGRGRLEVGYGRVVAHYRLGELAEAAKVLEEMIASVGERALFLEHGRMLLLLRAGIAADEGRLDEARAIYERLEPLAAASSGLRPYVRGAHATCRFAMGDLAGLDDDIERLQGDIRELPADHDIACSVATLKTRLRAARGEPATPVDAALWAEDRTFFQKLHGLVALEHAIRAGAKPEPEAWPSAEAIADNAELRVWAELCRALAAAVNDADVDTAVADASNAAESARHAGYGALEAEATNVRCEVLTVAGRFDEIARLVESFTAMAERLPSSRLTQSARFFGAISRDQGIDAAALEQIAARWETAPSSARRAQALLGGTPPVDALEEAMLDAVRTREPVVRIEPLTTTTDRRWSPGWGLDEPASAVWLADGRQVQFGNEALPWRILMTIAEHEGSIGKEELVLAAWEEREYHPLKHDNRLRLAVRKLRQVLEDDASNPTRLLTTSDGYAFGGHVRLLHRV